MATTLTKNGCLVNVVPMRFVQESETEGRCPPAEVLAETYRRYAILAPLEISPFDPLGEFGAAILTPPPVGEELGQEYSDHLDSIDSAEFELPEDYRV